MSERTQSVQQKTDAGTPHGSGLFLTVTLLLLLSVCGACLWIVSEARSRDALCEEEAQALRTRKAALEEDLAFVRNLLSLPPCEARQKWEGHTFRQ